jgi:hypothetical protein
VSSRKVTGLPLPETPREAPPEVHGLVDAIEDRLAESNITEAVLALGCAFDYLTRYFAAVAGATCDVLGLGEAGEVSADFESARGLLKERLLRLGEKSTDPASKLVRSIFFVGATRKTPTPRRHARLLDLGGIPIRGYLSLGEWIELKPGEKELATDAKANRELLRYLPILKEWITATSTFFLDTQQSAPVLVGDQQLTFELTISGVTKVAGPISVGNSVLRVLKPHLAIAAAAPAPEPPVATESADTDEPTTEVREQPLSPTNATEERPDLSEPPKIQVMGLDSDEAGESITPSSSQSKPVIVAPVPTAVTTSDQPPSQTDGLAGGKPPTQAEALATAIVEESTEPDAQVAPPPEESFSVAEPPVPVPPVTPAIESADVPDSLALPDPESLSHQPAEPTLPVIEPLAEPQTVDPPSLDGVTPQLPRLDAPTENTAVQDPPELTIPPALPEVPEPIAIPAAPDEQALKDPIVAALHKASASAKKAPAPVPAYQVYPLAEGPPPEFFDEMEVEADYPEILRLALTDLNGAIESNDSRLICGQMQRCFDVMIQFFAGLAGAVLFEIDEEALFDFDVEDGRFDLEVKIDLMVTSLSALEEFWEGNDAANLIWSVFYDTLLPATDPNCAYLHTRLLGVEGLVPKPFLEFSELCQVVPGEGSLSSQDQCRQMAHLYLPILSFWLENAMPLFLECEIDFVDEDDGDAHSWAATVAGATLDGTPSGFWLEVASNRWNLPRPELAAVFVSGDAPEVLVPVFDELNGALEKVDYARAGLYTRIALDFLVQYFTGCGASLWRQQGHMTEQALELFYPEASLAEKERLLLLSLGGVSTESEVGSSLGKLFHKGSLQYRALSQRGQPTGMSPISEWATSRKPVTEAELLIYLPLLRSWIGAANPWFSSGEQLFEEPSPDGVLEGVVAYGDDFLEMVDPEYVIQLARECLDLVAPDEEPESESESESDAAEEQKADSPFTGKLPQLPILIDGPPVLVGHVGRLLEAADDRRTANAWLGSSFEYLIQYFAGLTFTLLGGATSAIDRSVVPYFSPTASLRQREILLVSCIEHLKTAATGSVQEGVRDIFLKPDGSYRDHTKYLGVLGAGCFNENEMLLSYWCRARHQAGHLSTNDLHFGMSILNSWLDASKPFFASCEHYAEDPGPDGQEEMVVELADDYLDMVMPDYAIQIPARGYYEVLYKESDSEALTDVESFFPEDVRPELLGPKEVVLGGAADVGGDELLGAATDPGGDDFFTGAADKYDADDLFAGSAVTQKLDIDDMFTPPTPTPTPEPEKAKGGPVVTTKTDVSAPQTTDEPNAPEKRKKKKKRSKKQELGSAVLQLYKKERLEKARKRAEARARKAEADPTILKYTLQYRGLKNSKQLGGRGHFGLIELSNAGGGELKGTIEPAHPCVRVKPTRFEGNQVRVVYQVDPADMPSTGRAGLTINTQDQKEPIVLRLDRLVPTSWWRERSNSEALALLAIPSLAYSIWLVLLLGVVLGPSLEVAFESFGRSTHLESVPWKTHMKAWLFAMLAILPGATAVPALIKWMFAKFDYTVQEEIRWSLVPTMMLPSVIMAGLMYGTKFWVFNVPPARLPLLASRHVLTVMTFGLNLLATSLFSLQTTMWWEDRQDSDVAKRTFIGFWALTVLLGVGLTFFMW